MGTTINKKRLDQLQQTYDNIPGVIRDKAAELHSVYVLYFNRYCAVNLMKWDDLEVKGKLVWVMMVKALQL